MNTTNKPSNPPKSGKHFKHFKGGRYVVVMSGVWAVSWKSDGKCPEWLAATVEATMQPCTVSGAANGEPVIFDAPPSIANENCVIYMSMKNGKMFVRTESDFSEHVIRPDYNYEGPRFHPDDPESH